MATRQRAARGRGTFVRGVAIVASYVRTHPVPFALSIVGSTVYSVATVWSAEVLGRVTDKIIYPSFRVGVPAPTLWLGVGALVAVTLVRAAAIVVRRYFAGMTFYRMQATLRANIVDRYRQLPLAFYRSRPTGELLAHAEADVLAATEVLNPVPFSIAVLMLVVFAVVSLLTTDVALAAIGLLMLPSLALLNRLYGRVVEAAARRAQERIGDVSAVAHESIDGALVVKTIGRERSEVKRLEARAAQLQEERTRVGRLRASFEPAFEAVPNLGIIVLLGVGSWRLATGTITVGTLVEFMALFQLLSFPMRMIGFVLSEVPRAVVGRERLQGVFREPLEVLPEVGGASLPEGPLGLSVRHVSFAYGGPRVLDDVSFAIGPNESVALVGETGSGKSTLAQLLVRLADPDRGRIRVGGIDIRDLAPGHLQQAVSVVFQRSFLFASSIRDNITLEARAGHSEVARAAALAQADGFVRALPQGYDTVVGERGVTLSGGQRQRIALARALLRRPRILILDDATSAVDPTVEAAILKGLRDKLATTLIVIAYRISTIELADSVLFLENGRITAQGRPSEMLGHPPYSAMVRAYERAGV
jgi:ATP-binding cassette, subfamily B, bacterial